MTQREGANLEREDSGRFRTLCVSRYGALPVTGAPEIQQVKATVRGGNGGAR